MLTAPAELIGKLAHSASPTYGVPRRFTADAAGAAPAGKVSITAPDTLWADTSKYQAVHMDLTRYPYWDWCPRSNDGTYDDPLWQYNHARGLLALGQFGTVDKPNPRGLAMLGTYVVFRDNWQETVANLESQVGAPHARQWFLWDLESWGGALRGDKSAAFKAACYATAEWIGGHLKLTTAQALKRVWGYANAGDRAALCPDWPAGVAFLLANYSNNDGPAHIAHQFSSSYDVPPFGRCDINSADGLTVAELAAARGITLPTSSQPKPPPPPPAGHPHPSTGDRGLDAVNAFAWGTGYGDITPETHPNLVPADGMGVMERLDRLERKAGIK